MERIIWILFMLTCICCWSQPVMGTCEDARQWFDSACSGYENPDLKSREEARKNCEFQCGCRGYTISFCETVNVRDDGTGFYGSYRYFCILPRDKDDYRCQTFKCKCSTPTTSTTTPSSTTAAAATTIASFIISRLYNNQKVVAVRRAERDLRIGGVVASALRKVGIVHQGVLATLEDGNQVLIHKMDDEKGTGGHTIVTEASQMTGNWRVGTLKPTVGTVTVGDLVVAGGPDYKIARDNCIHSTDRMMHKALGISAKLAAF